MEYKSFIDALEELTDLTCTTTASPQAATLVHYLVENEREVFKELNDGK